MYLTAEGRAVLPYVDMILSSYNQILSFGSGETGQLRIAMPETLLMFRISYINRLQSIRWSCLALRRCRRLTEIS